MKATFVFLLLISLSVLAEPKVDEPILSSNTFEQTDYYYSAKIRYPILGNCVTKERAKLCEKFNKNIFKIVEKYKKPFSKSKLKKKRQEVDQILKDKEILPQNNQKYKHLLKVTYESFIKENSFVSILFKVQENGLEEHGKIYFESFHYDLNKEKKLDFNKVFNTKKESLQKLNQVLEANKPKDNCLTTKVAITKKQPFLMTDQEFSFGFAPYELGPYKCGSIVLKVSRKKLQEAGILK